MVVLPTSDIILLKCPLEIDNNNQLTFTSRETQYNYFYSLTKLIYTDCSYIRQDGVIRYKTSEDTIQYDDLIKYNYCMYRNKSYGNKWFYAYITNIKWVNNGVCDIQIETDSFQSWQFDIEYKPSFIEREMILKSDDIRGANTIPEGLELGEYISCHTPVESNYSDECYVCVATTSDYDTSHGQPILEYNGVFSGLRYYIFKNIFSCAYWLSVMDRERKGDAPQSFFMVPKSMFGSEESISWDNIDNVPTTYYKNVPSSSTYYDLGELTTVKKTTIGENYTPVNAKLLTYPYCYILASNNSGTDVIYKYEDFKNTEIKFDIFGAITPGCSIKVIPKNYKNLESNLNESFNAGKLPTCAWVTDVYINYLTQTGVNLATSGLSDTVNTLAGVITKNPSQIQSGLFGSLNNLTQIYEHSLIPPQAKGNLNSSDVLFAMKKSDVILYHMSIKTEFAKYIDSFFSAYGYKTNQIKIPNTNNRSNWNFVKTSDINIEGNIPQKEMQNIKDMFNKGLTLWHNPQTFLDYSQTNN